MPKYKTLKGEEEELQMITRKKCSSCNSQTLSERTGKISLSNRYSLKSQIDGNFQIKFEILKLLAQIEISGRRRRVATTHFFSKNWQHSQ